MVVFIAVNRMRMEYKSWVQHNQNLRIQKTLSRERQKLWVLVRSVSLYFDSLRSSFGNWEISMIFAIKFGGVYEGVPNRLEFMDPDP